MKHVKVLVKRLTVLAYAVAVMGAYVRMSTLKCHALTDTNTSQPLDLNDGTEPNEEDSASSDSQKTVAPDAKPDEVSFAFSDTDDGFKYNASIAVSARRPNDSNSVAQMPAFLTIIDIDPNVPRFQTLPELLGGTVGVTVKDFGGLGKLSTVSIRGSSANQVIVLLDGVRINTASDSGVDLSALPLDNVAKVEVLRGADSAVFGSGAIGGVVNLITRKDSQPGWSGNSALTYGAWNTANASASVWSKRDRLSLRLTTAYRHTDGDFSFTNDNGTAFNPDDDFNDTRSNNGMDAFDASLWFQAKPYDQMILSGSLEHYFADKGIPGLTTFPSEKATQNDRRLTGFLRLERDWPGALWHQLFAEMTTKIIHMDFADPEGEQTGVPVDTRQRTRAGGGRFGWNFGYPHGDGGLAVHYDSEGLSDNVFGDPSRTSFAVSGRHDLRLPGDTAWLSTMLRYDSISDAGQHWSPKIGVRWFITDRLSLKSNAGFGFRAPSLNELYLEAGYITGNPDLEAEKALSIDAGISYEARRWRVEAAWFSINSDDLIQYQLVSGFRYKPFNIGQARSQGFEVDGAVTLGGGVTLSGSYTWDKAVDRSGEPNVDGKQIPGRPEHDIFTKIEWNRAPIGVWMEWHYLSGNFVTRANTKELDSRFTGNAGITWVVRRWAQVGIEIKNLSNDCVVDVRGFPLPPRAWFASVRITM